MKTNQQVVLANRIETDLGSAPDGLAHGPRFTRRGRELLVFLEGSDVPSARARLVEVPGHGVFRAESTLSSQPPRWTITRVRDADRFVREQGEGVLAEVPAEILRLILPLLQNVEGDQPILLQGPGEQALLLTAEGGRVAARAPSGRGYDVLLALLTDWNEKGKGLTRAQLDVVYQSKGASGQARTVLRDLCDVKKNPVDAFRWRAVLGYAKGVKGKPGLHFLKSPVNTN